MEISANLAPGSVVLSSIIGTYNREIEKSLTRIASGLRVNKPSDDTGNYFRGQDLERRANLVSGLSRDLEDHIGRIKTTEDQLGTVEGILDKMAALSLEASTETNASVRGTLGKEYDTLYASLSTLSNTTRYDGALVLNGTYDSGAGGSSLSAILDEDVGNDTFSYDLLDTRPDQTTGLNLIYASMGGGAASAETDWADAGAGTTNAADYYAYVKTNDSGIKRLERNLNRVATNITVIEGARDALDSRESNYMAARSALVGVDQAEESSRLASLQIQQQAAASFIAQSNMSFSSVVGLLTASK